jgi:hypothetical protein
LEGEVKTLFSPTTAERFGSREEIAANRFVEIVTTRSMTSS